MKRPHYRELSLAEWRELHSICEKYLRRRFSKYGLPLCDLDDALVNSADDAYERICSKTGEIRSFKSFMRRVAFTSVARTLKKRGYRRNLVWIDAVPIVETQDDYDENPDDEKVEAGFVISDNGAGAEKIRADAERDLDRAPPLWLGLFEIAAKAQRGKARKVLMALKKDSRHVIAAGICGWSRQVFEYHLKKLRDDFALCYRAYRAYLM